jgi:hypothetical protein
MAETAREYLMHRFRGDAQALRDRIDALKRGTRIAGPDAATSQRMADACETVVSMIEAIVPHEDLQQELAALVALVPLLEQRARANEQSPPVRAVYSGAATRIREVEAAEAKAQADATGGANGAGHDDVDEDENDDDALFGEEDDA